MRVGPEGVVYEFDVLAAGSDALLGAREIGVDHVIAELKQARALLGRVTAALTAGGSAPAGMGTRGCGRVRRFWEGLVKALLPRGPAVFAIAQHAVVHNIQEQPRKVVVGEQLVEHGVRIVAVRRVETEPTPACVRAGLRIAVGIVAAPVGMLPVRVLVPAHGIVERGNDALAACRLGLRRN